MKYSDILQEIKHLIITRPDAEIDTQLVVEHLRLDPYSVDGRVLVEYVHDAMLDMANELLQHSQERIRRSRKRIIDKQQRRFDKAGESEKAQLELRRRESFVPGML